MSTFKVWHVRLVAAVLIAPLALPLAYVSAELVLGSYPRSHWNKFWSELAPLWLQVSYMMSCVAAIPVLVFLALLRKQALGALYIPIFALSAAATAPWLVEPRDAGEFLRLAALCMVASSLNATAFWILAGLPWRRPPEKPNPGAGDCTRRATAPVRGARLRGV